MNASQISKDLIEWIENIERKAEIHSIFKSTINIISEDGKFIPIVINNKPMSPFSIKLDKILDFNEINIAIGEKIIFKDKYLQGENIRIKYDQAKLWDNKVDLKNKIDSLINVIIKLDRVKEYILSEGNKDGIYGLMQFIPYDLCEEVKNNLDPTHLFIKERFIKFINAFEHSNLEDINELSRKIIGFGPGLTPSMDDFISGIMIANIYVTHMLNSNIENSYKLNAEIVRDIENKTTRVSEEMLKQASIGESNEDIRSLIISIVNKDNHSLDQLLKRVISFGHSSGTDILCGIYIGCKILINKHKEK